MTKQPLPPHLNADAIADRFQESRIYCHDITKELAGALKGLEVEAASWNGEARHITVEKTNDLLNQVAGLRAEFTTLEDQWRDLARTRRNIRDRGVA